MGGISIWQLLIIGLIVALLFGTNKLRDLGGDLGAAIKGFKKAMSEDETPKQPNDTTANRVEKPTEPTHKDNDQV